MCALYMTVSSSLSVFFQNNNPITITDLGVAQEPCLFPVWSKQRQEILFVSLSEVGELIMITQAAFKQENAVFFPSI